MIAPKTVRTSTPQRWRAALDRAVSEGIQVRQLQGSGMWVATSSTDPNTAYEVSPWECECQAGQFDDPVCKHRAALLMKLGRLRDAEPTLLEDSKGCHACHGTGIQRGRRAESRDAIITCPDCAGRGFFSPQRAA